MKIRFCYQAQYVFLFLAVMSFPGMGSAQEIEVVTEIWPPFRIEDPAFPDSISGIDIDLLQILSGRLGISLQVRRLPWARCLEFMRSGEADLITGLAYNKHRAEFIRYSKIPYHTVSPAFYVQKGKAAQIKTYSDLAAVTIGHSLKSAYFEPFDSDTSLKKTGVSTERQLLRMLAAGHVGAIIGTDANVEYDIAQMGLKNLIEKAVYQPEKHTDLYVGISMRSPLLKRADEIDRTIQNIVKGGKLLPILERYFGTIP